MPRDYTTVYSIIDLIGARIDRKKNLEILRAHFRDDPEILRTIDRIEKHEEEQSKLLKELRRKAEPK